MAESIQHVDTKQKIVALTFDADMTPVMKYLLHSGKVKSLYNEDVIRELEKEKIPATLFLTGMWIEEYGTTTRELSQSPLFELGNHSYSHGSFSGRCFGLHKILRKDDTGEVMKTDRLLASSTDSYMKFFRFPGLCSNIETEKVVHDLGYKIIGGDIPGGDGWQKNPQLIVSNVVNHVKPGSIVVLHMHGGPFAPQTAQALPEIISKLRAEGYTFVKVSDLLNKK